MELHECDVAVCLQVSPTGTFGQYPRRSIFHSHILFALVVYSALSFSCRVPPVLLFSMIQLLDRLYLQTLESFFGIVLSEYIV
jgi:hypothetical protein